MTLSEGTSRDALGGIVIRSRVAAPPGRSGYEKRYFPGVEVGLPGWERAHSQGSITGNESALGIRYAPQEANQAFQRLGIERFIAELFLEKAKDVTLWLTTVTYTQPKSLRLKEIQYRVDAERNGASRALFEAAIMVQDKRESPIVTIDCLLRTSRSDWGEFLK
jgi:hypothetical protein